MFNCSMIFFEYTIKRITIIIKIKPPIEQSTATNTTFNSCIGEATGANTT